MADQCPNTAAGATVDADGCADAQKDTDGDGVDDAADQCPNTAAGATVDAVGCADAQKDTDGDGVDDVADQCPNTAAGATVDADGCADAQKDTDGDGVDDAADQCSNTAAGSTVDADGCADAQKDTDGDTIADDTDNCPLIANSDQADLDSDGSGDLCDDDIDGDGIANADDEFGGDINTPFVQLDGSNPGSCSVDARETKLELLGADAARAPADPINNKVRFQLSCGTAGATVTVRVFFGEVLPTNPAVYKLVNGDWTLIPDAIIDRSNQSVLYPITDGGSRDADGSANRQIVDPVTVVSLPTTPAAPVPLPLWLLALIAGGLSVMCRSQLRSH